MARKKGAATRTERPRPEHGGEKAAFTWARATTGGRALSLHFNNRTDRQNVNSGYLGSFGNPGREPDST